MTAYKNNITPNKFEFIVGTLIILTNKFKITSLSQIMKIYKKKKHYQSLSAMECTIYFLVSPS